ncbi:hypothetical protein [Mycobacteroides abscessus]|uniref:hypothetical protein n=1 Tax=Mycobacteroides abscessus TaxID=36809 RepID=UPI0009A59F3C|nr:hypothetical protein [Mycobacteroides abscessus]SKF72326.1 Uncharacterised protein [Mycobacteroides abscessus subsp. bolletii]SKF76277.1 Uncharacterised protein [Mycobacteroides abscessus subsp. bolletii]SKH39586.1 Uncharacterised protein [Mycobacteroides abscessus subsp. bolletii]SKH82826.1 Uncharacterised protein [Mycobacteroides abscessus subsp. bolletii]SKH92431.1 Uncharacterised protein [Mycobacteroides abscessus subsp. bolletii]
MNIRRIVVLLPVYVILMLAVNALFRSLHFEKPGLSVWVVVGFVASALFSFGVLIYLARHRLAHGPFQRDKKAFAIAVLVAIVVSDAVDSVLYSALSIKSIYAAIPIEIFSYCVLIGVALVVLRIYSSQAEHK